MLYPLLHALEYGLIITVDGPIGESPIDEQGFILHDCALHEQPIVDGNSI